MTRLLIASLLSLLLAAFSTVEAKELYNKKKAMHPNRKIASVSRSVKTGGQGLAMLDNVKETSPRFLNRKATARGPVRFQGVCRNPYGAVYVNGEPGYASCITSPQNPQTNNYFGAVERQAGGAFTVGQ